MQVRHAPYRAESNHAPRRRALNLLLSEKIVRIIRTLLAGYQVCVYSSSLANEIFIYGRSGGRTFLDSQGGEPRKTNLQ